MNGGHGPASRPLDRMTLKCLVLAAGRSTRIEPLSGGRPKPLLEIAGESLIGWNLRWLAMAGIRETWINLHYRAEEIRAALGEERAGVRIRYSHEPELLGTAGAWKKLGEQWSGTSLLVYGDNLMRFDLASLLAAHREFGALATVALFDPAVHANTGIAGGRAELAKDGRIVGFVEGPSGPQGEPGPASGQAQRFVNAGAYLLEPGVLDWLEPGFQDWGRDVFPRLLASGKLYGCPIQAGGFVLGLDTPERFAIAQRLIDTGEVTLR